MDSPCKRRLTQKSSSVDVVGSSPQAPAGFVVESPRRRRLIRKTSEVEVAGSTLASSSGIGVVMGCPSKRRLTRKCSGAYAVGASSLASSGLVMGSPCRRNLGRTTSDVDVVGSSLASMSDVGVVMESPTKRRLTRKCSGVDAVASPPQPARGVGFEEIISAPERTARPSLSERSTLLKRRRGAVPAPGSDATARPGSAFATDRRARGAASEMRSSDDVVASFACEDGLPSASSSRIVTGFGRERVEDVAQHARRMDSEGVRRGVRRRDEGTRGRMTGFGGEDLDRAVGRAWQLGSRTP